MRGARCTAAVLALLAGCTTPEPDAARVAQARQQAEAAADRLVQALVAELGRAMSAGHPEEAIDVCAEVAQEITRQVSTEGGLTIRRTSLRCRNPVNVPDDYERAWLERESARLAAGGPAPTPSEEVVATRGDWELRYLRPILLARLCTQCHGSEAEISPVTREAIAARYPDDHATGFAPGDLRGVVSVRVPFE